MATTLMLGLLVGFTSLAMSTIALPQVEIAQSDDDQGEEKESDLSIKAFDAITSSVQVTLDHSFFLIDVLPEMEEFDEDFTESQEALSAGNKVLKILFRRIISPNAP